MKNLNQVLKDRKVLSFDVQDSNKMAVLKLDKGQLNIRVSQLDVGMVYFEFFEHGTLQSEEAIVL